MKFEIHGASAKSKKPVKVSNVEGPRQTMKQEEEGEGRRNTSI
jgi:hypothetical protein